MNEDKPVSEGINALAKLLRNTIVDSNEMVSVQEEIENVLLKINGYDTPIIASGRTDAKVHAKGRCFTLTVIVYWMISILPEQ